MTSHSFIPYQSDKVLNIDYQEYFKASLETALKIKRVLQTKLQLPKFLSTGLEIFRQVIQLLVAVMQQELQPHRIIRHFFQQPLQANNLCFESKITHTQDIQLQGFEEFLDLPPTKWTPLHTNHLNRLVWTKLIHGNRNPTSGSCAEAMACASSCSNCPTFSRSMRSNAWKQSKHGCTPHRCWHKSPLPMYLRPWSTRSDKTQRSIHYANTPKPLEI